MFSDRCEMAYGEQAALQGLLARLRPRLAMEVGTYQGGSLELIVPYADQLVSFDLVSHSPPSFDNVEYRLGDSRVRVPEFLHELSRDGHTLDFALIDGDHSKQGAYTDLKSVLDSPCASSCVVLLHDIANEAVRAGARKAVRESGRDLAYVNFSFVPSLHRAGVLGEAWGGLGIVVIADSADGWPHRRRVDENLNWATSTRMPWLWHVGRPARAIVRESSYRLRPIRRRKKGIRGVHGNDT